MAEYIERAGIIAEFHRLGLGENSLVEKIFADGVYAVLETFPAADVVPVKHGQWRKPNGGSATPFCSCCWKWAPTTWSGGYTTPPYCPSCGARMDGDDNG